jgi:hypothetical protein
MKTYTKLLKEALQSKTIKGRGFELYSYEYAPSKTPAREIIDALKAQGKAGDNERFVAVNLPNGSNKMFFTWSGKGANVLHHDMISLLKRERIIPMSFAHTIPYDGKNFILTDYNSDPRILVGMFKVSENKLKCLYENYKDMIEDYVAAKGDRQIKVSAGVLSSRKSVEVYFGYDQNVNSSVSSTRIFYSRWGWLKEVIDGLDKDIQSPSYQIFPDPWR